MMELTLTPEELIERQLRAKRTLLWIGLISIVMLFAGLTSAYLVRQAEGKWLDFQLPGVFKLSTLAILLSSIPMQWSVASIKKGDRKMLILGLLLTAILGSAFVYFQYRGWSELFGQGIAFTGSIQYVHAPGATYIPSGNETLAQSGDAGNVAGSFLYVLTGLHIAHLLAGMLALMFVLVKALRNKYSAAEYNGVRMIAVYWHFLGGLWLYLFLFLLYIR